MSLDWNVSKVKDYENLCWITLEEDLPSRFLKAGDSLVNPVTETLVFLTISAGIPEITEQNAAEFYARVRIIEATYGAFLSKHDENGGLADKPLTAEDIYNHIGLRTNATTLTKTAFTKNIYNVLLRKSAEEIERVADK
jgi:hypothetical protein